VPASTDSLPALTVLVSGLACACLAAASKAVTLFSKFANYCYMF